MLYFLLIVIIVILLSKQELGQIGKSFFQLVFSGDILVAVALFISHINCCDVLVISMDSDYAAVSPNYLLIQQGFLTMAERRHTIFNWQSSPSRRSGVYAFKRQWGSIDHKYYFVTKVFGDIHELISAGNSSVREIYSNHYIIPFGAFENPNQNYFKKDIS